MPISEELYKQMKCCISSDEHFVDDPVLVTKCGGNACKTCINKSTVHGLAGIVKCFYCKQEHTTLELQEMPVNITLKLLIEKEYLKELSEDLKAKLLNAESLVEEEKIVDEIDFKFECIANEIDIRIETLISELQEYRDTLKNELIYLKKSFQKCDFVERLKCFNEEAKNIYEKNKVDSYEYFKSAQDFLLKSKTELKFFRNKLHEINFKPSLSKIPIDVIGNLVSTKLSIHNKIKSINESNFTPEFNQCAYWISKKQVILSGYVDGSPSCTVLSENGNYIESRFSMYLIDYVPYKPHGLYIDKKNQIYISASSNIIILNSKFDVINQFSTSMLDTIDYILIDESSKDCLLYASCCEENKIAIFNSKTGEFMKYIYVDSPVCMKFLYNALYVTSETSYRAQSETNRLAEIKKGSNCIFVINKNTHELIKKIQCSHWLCPLGLTFDENLNLVTTAYCFDKDKIISRNRFLFVIDQYGDLINTIELSNVHASPDSINFLKTKCYAVWVVPFN